MDNTDLAPWYTFHFDFDGGVDDDDDEFVADAPSIFITGPDGISLLEVLEDPVPTVPKPDTDEAHWRLPDDSLTQRLLDLLNQTAADSPR